MFDTWSKNNEQKCWAELHMRLRPGLFSSDFSFLIFIRPPTQQRFCFSHDALWQGAGNTDKGKHLKPTSHTNLPSSAQPQNKKKGNLKKKKITENMVMLFTQLSLVFLDLNYKHTSIFQLHISPTYSVPLIAIHYYSSKRCSRADSALQNP